MANSFLKFMLALLCALSFAAGAQAQVRLGVDVLQDSGFAVLRGKRVGLLTHPAGVNANGVATVEVLRRAAGVKLAALYGPEHGIYGDEKANVSIANRTDARTGLPVYSLYGKTRKPTPEMLKNIDVLVIDLQDIGSRSYTYTSCMLRAMEACFEQGREVVVLDRPNPLGGLKVDGPPLDEKFKSYVGMFKVPYVHGMTIGELALMAKNTAGAMEITSAQQKAGKLTVIPMKGWTRSMVWSRTGLKWVRTSPAIPDFPAVVGYAMTGLGCQLGDFQHGYGTQYPFRLLTFKGMSGAELMGHLKRKNVPGVDFVLKKGVTESGKEVDGVYVLVTDFNALKPTLLSLCMMQLACELSHANPFARAAENDALLFNKHLGSQSWWNELCSKGKNADAWGYASRWEAEAKKFQQWSRRFWLYQ